MAVAHEVAGLRSLPDEILIKILHFVALQRYEYSESRRPTPSALISISSCNCRLREIAAPFIYRNAEQEGGSVDKRWHVRQLTYVIQHPLLNNLSTITICRQDGKFPRLDTLIVNGGGILAHGAPNRLEIASETLRTLRIRKLNNHRMPFDDIPLWYLPRLEDLQLDICSHEFVSHMLQCADSQKVHSLKRLDVTFVPIRTDQPMLDSNPVEQLPSWPHKLWTTLKHLRLVFPPGGTGEGHSRPRLYLIGMLKDFELPQDAVLESLSLQVRLEVHASAVKVDFQPFKIALGPFAHLGNQLRELELDDYVLVTPDDVAYLASWFPALEKLSWGDRTVWKGSLSAHREAMRAWTNLRELTLPRWEGQLPEAEGISLADGCTAAEQMCALLARDLPRLELLCYSGSLSQPEWARIRRRPSEASRALDSVDPSSWQVEAVTIIDMDLGRP